MKEPYRERSSDHSGPESCVVTREGGGEALTGAVRAGLLSPEMCVVRRADHVVSVGRQQPRGRYREGPWTPRGQRTCARTETPCSGTGRSRTRPVGDGPPVREGNPKGARPR